MANHSSHTPPNILFVTSDQHHPDHIGLEDDRLKTPCLDRLGAEGVLLSRSYTCSPVCIPARATWVTGQYPSKHGAWAIGVVLDEQCLSVARLLGEAGYRTAMFGKSHLQPCLNEESSRWGETGPKVKQRRGDHGITSKEAFPRAGDTAFHRRWQGPWYGFAHAEINVGHVNEPHSASMHYRAWLEDQGVDIAKYFSGRDFDKAQVWPLPVQFHPCTWAADRAIAYLRDHRAKHADAPFYLNLNFPDPHPPFHAPEPFFNLYQNTAMRKPIRRWNEWEDKPAFYRAVVNKQVDKLGWQERYSIGNPARAWALDAGPQAAESYTDQEAGVLRAYWAMISLLDAQFARVLEVLDELGLAGNTLVVYTSDHGDLMGDHFLYGKGACHYQGSVRVPTLARWPGVIPAGGRCAGLLSNVDLAPTFLAAAGRPVHPQMQGVNQVEVWRGKSPAARPGVWVDFRAERGLYVNSWITDRYRLSVHNTADGDEVELYDLREDPHEFTNLAAKGNHSELVATLMSQLLREVTSTACAWQERIAFA